MERDAVRICGAECRGRRKSPCHRPPEQTAEVTPPFPNTRAGALEESRYGGLLPSPYLTVQISQPVPFRLQQEQSSLA